jgi:hypothetical protein
VTGLFDPGEDSIGQGDITVVGFQFVDENAGVDGDATMAAQKGA